VHFSSIAEFSKGITRLTSLRARLLFLLFLILLPVYSFILYTIFDARQLAIDNARKEARSFIHLVAQKQINLIEIARQQLVSISQLSVVRRADSVSQCNNMFAELHKQYPIYANLGVIDKDGTVRCSAVPLKGRLNLSHRRYFIDAMATRDFVIGDYQTGLVTGKTSLNLAYPVLDANGHSQAVMYIALDLNKLSGDLPDSAILPEGSRLMILDNLGTVLARNPDLEHWVGKSLPDAPLTQYILKHRDGGNAEEPGIDGVKRLYVYEPLYKSSTQQVYISAGIPLSAVYADANTLLFRALLLMAVVTSAVIALAWFGSWALILRPMIALKDATGRIGHGDFDARTKLQHTPDEFGQLAHSLDDMADSLQARHSEAVRAEARFTNIVNMAADAIISVDEEQRIIIFNYGAEQIFGYTSAEMLGQPLSILLPERYTHAHHQHVRQFAKATDVSRHMNRRPDIFGRRKDGNEFFAEASISRAQENGKMVFTVFLRDISERKEAEEQIRQLNINLERRVTERTAELAAANEELEAFSYSVSHDLRTPLRAIDGFSQVIVEDFANKIEPQAMDYLGRIRAASQRMGVLIDDMLALSRVTRTEMLRNKVNLSLLANNVLVELQKSAPDRKIQWQIKPGLTCMGDLRLLNMVLVNLFSNAWKFTAHSVQPHIEFGSSLNIDGKTEFFVRDNGAGFDMAYANKLFGPFQRLHSTTEFPGTGVGLAIVKRIILRHGGTIRGESTVGQGATFYFTLPD
jgi:PAS domain S-box-containing protein